MPNKVLIMNFSSNPLRCVFWSLLLSAFAVCPRLAAQEAAAQPAAAQPADGEASAQPGQEEFAAVRLLRTAEENFESGFADRGVALLENLLERYPGTAQRFKAALLLARHYVDQNQEEQASAFLRQVLALDRATDPLTPEEEEMLQEALYLQGKSAFRRQNYSEASPYFRRIIQDFPTSQWANEAYYFIGMGHFAQSNWQGAIETLAMVGTVGEIAGADTPFMEANRRFYIRLEDPDLPILHRLGEKIQVEVTSLSGDREVVECVPVQSGSAVFMGSVPTRVGAPKPSDNILQVRGGDTVVVNYMDRNTEAGESNVGRILEKQVVSTARIFFTPGNYDGQTEAGFIGQPAYLELEDVDLSVSDAANEAEITLISRYKVEVEADEVSIIMGTNAEQEEGEKYEERDRITIRLSEAGDPPVRSGIFRGRVNLVSADQEAVAGGSMPSLKVKLGDEVVAEFSDQLHIGGDSPREVTAKITVSGDLQSLPRATQYVVDDPLLRAEKNLVEAGAFLELARIFREMGLKSGSDERADETLALLDQVLKDAGGLSVPILENTYRMKWETQILKENFQDAIRTCAEFARRFPDSPVVEEAYLKIADIYFQQEKGAGLGQARGIYQNLLRSGSLPAQAQSAYRLALISQQTNSGNPGAAIPLFQNVAERFPQSEFAGEALARVIDFHIEQSNYPVAQDLLEQVFADQPDAPYLDSMLMKWVALALRRGDFATAVQKSEQLLFDYPGSRFAARAQELLPRIRQRL